MDLHFFKNKKVFVTGHTGFKGSWLLVILDLLGAKVKGFALAPNDGQSLFHSINGEKLCDSEIGDINNPSSIKTEITNFQPDILIHLAAQPLVRLSYRDPINTYLTNVIGTANVLEGVKALDKQCEVVLITTDKVYENKEWHYPYRENDQLGGYDPYSSSKACAEILIASYRNSFFNPNQYGVHRKSIASVRAGNVIGGGDWAEDRIIPDIIRAFMKNNPVHIRNPFAIRPWQHVIEPLFGYLEIAQRMYDSPLKFGEPWNFGPLMQDSISVKQLVDIAIRAWGSGTMRTDDNTEIQQPHEAKLLMLDISKTLRRLDWKPVYSSKNAIETTINWYKKVNQGNDALAICQQQINSYIDSILN